MRTTGDANGEKHKSNKGKEPVIADVSTREVDLAAEANPKQKEEWAQVSRKTGKGSSSRARGTTNQAYPTLFVRGYPEGWLPINISRIFGQASAVMDVIMPRDRHSGTYRGFALVKMSSEEELARAMEMLHGEKFAGVPPLVQRVRFGLERTQPRRNTYIPSQLAQTNHLAKPQSKPQQKQGGASFKNALLNSHPSSHPQSIGEDPSPPFQAPSRSIASTGVDSAGL
ncbi:serine/arginine-rich SC35-like splicing factor SCL30 [Magnolia sinica]|uniref:serine/arginine-rich SC35-like splicing factor SCL30 n=1 Tax=Magnolia sinica TaxID=86752 RepID=UPI00265A9947|nr:serine/arginine-rich SC35-like splicing factor SCL30 [Magnolia sinica]